MVCRGQQHGWRANTEIAELKRRTVSIFEMAPADDADHQWRVGSINRARNVAGKGAVPGLLRADKPVEF